MYYYLYLKTHNKTGLKYLGKTTQNPYTYKGSGKYWKTHLKKHGDDISTEILFQTEDRYELINAGIYFSCLYNIVESKDFANLIVEQGDGGAIRNGMKNSEKQKLAASKAKKGKNHHQYGKPLTQKQKEAISKATKKPKSEEHKVKIGLANKGNKRSDLAEYNRKRNSIPVIFKGKRYSSIKEITEEYQLTRWYIKKDPSFQFIE